MRSRRDDMLRFETGHADALGDDYAPHLLLNISQPTLYHVLPKTQDY